MKLKRASSLAILAMVLVLGLCFCEGEGEREKEAEGAVKAPERVSVIGGERVVKLSAAERDKAGIEVRALSASSVEQTMRAYATVTSVSKLSNSRQDLAAAMAAKDKAEAALNASKPEYERLQRLHDNGGNASAKALESARAELKADEAAVEAAREGLDSAQSRCREEWGGTICGWMAGPAPPLARVLEGRDVLVLITLPEGIGSKAPAKAQVEGGPGKSEEASLVSPSPRMDPRFQGRACFYQAPRSPWLLPGANVTALLGTGTADTGCVIPRSSEVWWEGKAWVYEEKAAGQFTRRELAVDRPRPDGWFVGKDQCPDAPVVIEGAEQLLSEEFRSSIQAEQDED